jgi:hypothetical protein
MLKGRQKSPKVIPAKAGIHASYWRWIPAFAGMTVRRYERLHTEMVDPLISLNISGEKRGDISVRRLG